MKSLRCGVWLLILCGFLSPGQVPGAPVLSPAAIGAWRTSEISFWPMQAGGATNVILSFTAAMGLREGDVIGVSLEGGFPTGSSTGCIPTSSSPPNVFGSASRGGGELLLPIYRSVADGTLVSVVILSRSSGSIILPASGLPANHTGLTMRTNAFLGPIPPTSIRSSPGIGSFSSAKLSYAATAEGWILSSATLTPTVQIGAPVTTVVNGTQVTLPACLPQIILSPPSHCHDPKPIQGERERGGGVCVRVCERERERGEGGREEGGRGENTGQVACGACIDRHHPSFHIAQLSSVHKTNVQSPLAPRLWSIRTRSLCRCRDSLAWPQWPAPPRSLHLAMRRHKVSLPLGTCKGRFSPFLRGPLSSRPLQVGGSSSMGCFSWRPRTWQGISQASRYQLRRQWVRSTPLQ